ncbi:hypothetical protein R3P38DRAFT_2979646 [Favolaschia claudopus]|uniref:Uncharacterized protein n=1 Tax=Favolaschia claudopus TaxID=2862362 RepID=A0AAW0AZ73_9AGAR
MNERAGSLVGDLIYLYLYLYLSPSLGSPTFTSSFIFRSFFLPWLALPASLPDFRGCACLRDHWESDRIVTWLSQCGEAVWAWVGVSAAQVMLALMTMMVRGPGREDGNGKRSALGRSERCVARSFFSRGLSAVLPPTDRVLAAPLPPHTPCLLLASDF